MGKCCGGSSKKKKKKDIVSKKTERTQEYEKSSNSRQAPSLKPKKVSKREEPRMEIVALVLPTAETEVDSLNAFTCEESMLPEAPPPDPMTPTIHSLWGDSILEENRPQKRVQPPKLRAAQLKAVQGGSSKLELTQKSTERLNDDFPLGDKKRKGTEKTDGSGNNQSDITPASPTQGETNSTISGGSSNQSHTSDGNVTPVKTLQARERKQQPA